MPAYSNLFAWMILTVNNNKDRASWLLAAMGSAGDFYICGSKNGLFKSLNINFPECLKMRGVCQGKRERTTPAKKLNQTGLPTIY